MDGRAVLRRIAAQAIFALVAGGLVFMLEASDRMVVLRYNLDGFASNAALAVLTAAAVFFVALVATGFGAFFTLADWLRSAVTARLTNVPDRWRWLAGLVVSSAIVAVVLRVLSWLAPTVVEGPVYRLIARVDKRLSDIGPIADHPKLVFILLLSAATLALMAFHAWLFSRRGPRARVAAIAIAVVSLVLVAAGYWADSRIEFTRYEYMFHVPLEIIYSVLALVGVTAVARVFGDPSELATQRAPVLLSLVLLAAALGSILFGYVAMDAQQEAKTFFWSRSVVARRVFQFARFLTDGDRDGFADTFGGADLNDHDPNVHPLAAETPLNGVDDNCIGGELAESGSSRGSLFGVDGSVVVPVTEARPSGLVPAGDADVSVPPGTRNIIFISIDCLRADHMSLHGYHRPTTPNIEKLAAESLVFDYAIPQGTNTGHSFTSLFRSSYGEDIFDDRVPTVLRLLKDRGYKTTLLNTVRTDVWLNAARWSKYRAMTHDAEAIHNEGERYWDAEKLTNESIAFLDALPPEQSHFTWIHYFDVHRPRAFHKEHNFGRSDKNRYDGNIQYVDKHVGRLVAHLRETGVLDRAILIITADHGEAFMEHGAWEHSNKPYNNNAHVPLIIRAPGAGSGRFGEPVALVDVAPTILGFVGLRAPPYYRGIDLIAAARGGGPPRRQIVSETPRNLIESPFYSWALVEWPYKVIWDLRSNTLEVFDIEKDYAEQNDLADKDPALAARMRAALGRWLDVETARTGAVGPGDDADVDD